jgi:phosphoglycolate phosphatase
MLADLKAKGFQLAVATGKSRRGLDKTLAMLPMEGVFHATRTADETAGKPDPRMLHELMHELAVAPARTLMVGDTSHDLQMANNAGCMAVGVSYGAHPLPQLQALNPLFIASSAHALHRGLLQHSKAA